MLFIHDIQSVADFVTDEDLKKGSLYPPLKKVKSCSIDIAVKIAEYAYSKGKFFQHDGKLETSAGLLCANVLLRCL